MSRRPAFVVVGAGLAGGKAVETLRAEGFEGTVTLLGEEPHRPYERPPLSKGYLAGTAERESVFLQPEGWYAEHDVDLRTGVRAVSIDRQEHDVVLADGGRVPYDALLLATGSRSQRLALPGADLTGIHYLRTLDDADSLKAALASARRVAVIGGGWIGLEVAAAARGAGLEVALLEQAPRPLQRVLGREVARIFADLHRAHGVDVRGRVRLARFLGGADGALEAVELADGARVEADLAVVGIGIQPDTVLAEEAWLQVGDGVHADEHLRTSDPHIYAAGDVANAYHPVIGCRLRVEHWANALHHGPVAARSMLGQRASISALPFFFTDQYDLGMEYVGFTEPGNYDQVVLRGDVPGLHFVAFWLRAGRVVAGMHGNRWGAIKPLEALVRSGRKVDPARLADDAVPLKSL